MPFFHNDIFNCHWDTKSGHPLVCYAIFLFIFQGFLFARRPTRMQTIVIQRTIGKTNRSEIMYFLDERPFIVAEQFIDV